VFLHKTFL